MPVGPFQRCDQTGDAFPSCRVEDGAIAGAIAVEVRVNAASDRNGLTRFSGVRAGNAKATEQRLRPAAGFLEPRQFVDPGAHKAVASIERRVSAFTPQVLKILHAARRQYSREYFRSRIVNQVTPSIRIRPLETAREAFLNLDRTSEVVRISV